jgi:hypothetical protein
MASGQDGYAVVIGLAAPVLFQEHLRRLNLFSAVATANQTEAD